MHMQPRIRFAVAAAAVVTASLAMATDASALTGLQSNKVWSVFQDVCLSGRLVAHGDQWIPADPAKAVTVRTGDFYFLPERAAVNHHLIPGGAVMFAGKLGFKNPDPNAKPTPYCQIVGKSSDAGDQTAADEWGGTEAQVKLENANGHGTSHVYTLGTNGKHLGLPAAAAEQALRAGNAGGYVVWKSPDGRLISYTIVGPEDHQK